MSYQPIANNQSFSKVAKTTVSPAELYDLHEAGRFTQLREVNGWICPMAGSSADVYVVKDNDGRVIQLPLYALVDSVSYGGVPFGGVLGGTSAQAGLVSGVATVDIDYISDAAVVADINRNKMLPSTLDTGIVKTYLAVETNGTFLKNTECSSCYWPKVSITVKYMDPQDINRTGQPSSRFIPDSGTLAAYYPFVSPSALTPGSLPPGYQL